ncbi:hypothetical protein ACFWPV_09765 [Streptomyces uncialis]|uniref:hypothetical protein n=1 Tax=Streptomyces uncialis TaxID=1048205 RepID=UPI003653572C
MDCATHKGHRRWVGGSRDGHVDHLVHATPSDFPDLYGTMLRAGTRCWYEVDHAASAGTEVVYRFVGSGRVRPLPQEEPAQSAGPEQEGRER